MRRLRALAFTLATAGSLLTTSACPSADGGTQRPGEGKASGVEGLVDPLPLPERPPALLHVQNPRETVEVAARAMPIVDRVDEILRLSLVDPAQWGVDDGVARTVLATVDPGAPVTGAMLAGDERILHMQLLPDQVDAAKQALVGAPEGEFGAVRLSQGDARSVFAWVDTRAPATLTFATSLSGLATGRQLAPTYGKAPLVARVDPSQYPLPEGVEVPPVEFIEASGTVDDLRVDLSFTADQNPLGELDFDAGAMGALLRDPAVLAGASSRWKGYEKAVDRAIGEIQVQLDELPFLLRGWATDLAKRFNAILRSWNGRVLLASADGHLRVAYGSDDAKKSGVAVLHFLRGALDGLSLVSNFTSDAPDIKLKKNAGRAGEIEIHRIDLRRLPQTPKELAPLLDERGALHIAMAFDARLGGGAFVIGPDAVGAMERWLGSATQPVAAIDASPLAAIHLGLSREQLATLGELARAMAEGTQDAGGQTMQLLEWRADGPAYDLELQRTGDRGLSLRITGPGPR